MKIIFDLDGTLADITHRLHMIDKSKGKPDWPAFFMACVDDKPIPEMVRLARCLAGCTVDIWSGRSDIVRPQTEFWLDVRGLGFVTGDHLRMRKEGDYRADHIVKEDWLYALPKSQWPDIVFDDRKQVVDMWRVHGIRCCQVAPGEF